MDALILAAGFGSRLKNLTHNTPKCLLKIKGKPVIAYWIDALLESGIQNIYINTHYLSDLVSNYINFNYSKESIFLVHEEKLLGTAGTLIDIIPKTQHDLFVLHADNYFNGNVVEHMINKFKYKPDNATMLMLVFKYQGSPKNFGVVEINRQGMLKNFYEKELEVTNLKYANAATYILSMEMKNYIINNFKNSFDISKDIIPKVKNKIYTVATNSLFMDIGSIENYELLNK